MSESGILRIEGGRTTELRQAVEDWVQDVFRRYGHEPQFDSIGEKMVADKPGEIPDLVIDAATSVWSDIQENPRKYDDADHVKKTCWKALKRKWLDYKKTNSNREIREAARAICGDQTGGANPAEEAERNEQRDRARELFNDCLEQLSDYERELLTARDIQDPAASIAELAESYDKPKGTIQSHLSRARDKLRWELNQRGVWEWNIDL